MTGHRAGTADGRRRRTGRRDHPRTVPKPGRPRAPNRPVPPTDRHPGDRRRAGGTAPAAAGHGPPAPGVTPASHTVSTSRDATLGATRTGVADTAGSRQAVRRPGRPTAVVGRIAAATGRLPAWPRQRAATGTAPSADIRDQES
ncbi:hypothetical protein GCM10011594_20880 [Nakamurella endophytica]|uniref:Uncharacterized protein n=1 Tax=Nakamurella endophytica TaxID=1748367 RepID=A0A917SVA3_9ACTN|nr:hypothetical protein GCM10011594_20880 [Nakamurella endophytica]